MNSRFTCNLFKAFRPVGGGTLAVVALLIWASLSGAVHASTSDATLPPATISASDDLVCLGSSVTFTLGSLDFPETDVVDVPWMVSYQGVVLDNANLGTYLTLDANVGANLSDWSQSTTLTFTPLLQGCYTVSVDPYVFFNTATQNVGVAQIIVADAPEQPQFVGFDDVVQCDGGIIDGGLYSNTTGEIDMNLTYTFSDNVGTVVGTDTLSASGEACDGPSINMGYTSAPLSVGAYVFEAVAENTCGTSTNSFDVEIVAFPSFALSTDPICTADDATVFSDIDVNDYAMSDGALPTATALWSNGGTDLAQNVFTTPTDGDAFTQNVSLFYELLGDDATCEAEEDASQVVHIPGSIDLVITGGTAQDPSLVCDGSTLVLSLDNVSAADPVETFVWTTDVPPSSSTPESMTWESFELDVIGSIVQTSVWADGTSCDNSIDFELFVNPKPELVWFDGDANVCENDDAGLIVQTSFASTAVVDVVWALPDGTTDTVVANGNAPTPILLTGDNFAADGQYPVIATPTDDLGCPGDPIEGLVEVFDNPAVQATFAEVCEGGSIVPSAVPTGASYSYQWQINGGTFMGQGASGPTPTFDNIACGDVIGLTVQRTYSVDGDPLTCNSEELLSTLDVVLVSEPVVTTASSLCDGVDIALDLSEANEGANCQAPTVTYSWTVDDGTSMFSHTGTLPYVLPGGDYTTVGVHVEAVSTGPGGLSCPSTATFSFDVDENPELESLALDWVLCSGSDLDITGVLATNPNGGVAYSWNNADVPGVFNIDHPTPFSADASISLAVGSTASEGTLTLSVVDAGGCVTEVSTVVDVWELPVSQGVAWSEDHICSDDEVVLSIAGFDADPSNINGVDYTWSAEGSNGIDYTVVPGAGLESTVTGLTSQSIANEFFNAPALPVALSFTLDLDDGVCQNQEVWMEVVNVYRKPKVSNTSDNDVCMGSDWQGVLVGATDLEWTNPDGLTYSGNAPGGDGITWTVPWDEIDIYTTSMTQVQFPLTATSDHGFVQCSRSWNLNLDVLENPGINPNNINVPESICVESTETVSSSIAESTGQGQPITYQWSNVGAQTFNISGSGNSVNISVNTDAGIPDDGTLAFSITDSQGCSVDTTYTILIYELPVMGTLTVDPLAACSEDEIAVEMTGVTVDDGLDPNDVEYTWSGTIATGDVDFVGTGSSVIAIPEIDEVAFQDFVAPEELELGLTISIAGCESSASWTSQVDIYPGPERTADNTLVCTDQDWEATVTGCEVLTVYGQNGLPDITWTTADPAVGMDIVLPNDYLLAQSGQTQTTFFFYAGVTYPDIPLTCYTERPFVLGRRQAPSFSVVGNDTSGPSADVVLCEGEDLTLTGTAVLNNVTITYDWQQYELNGVGDLVLVPVAATSDDEAYFVDVVPAGALDQPTLVEGVAAVTYSGYNNSGDFECVVEEPWSFQVMPNPVVDWNIPETHVCSGENAVVEVALLAGATSLNGVDVEWDWDWDVSTFSSTVHTTEPNDVLDIESLYESTLSGMFEQDLSVVVTDSYGCVSDISENSFTALQVPELNLERSYVCEGDTLEVLGTGADVYTWSPDLAGLDAELLDAVYFPNYVPTGDSVQTLVLNQPASGEVITLVGQLVYPLDETTTLTCEATTDIVLIVFDLPILDATFASDPAPYCEGDVMNFEDANTEGNLNNISYTYWTSGGLESEDDPSNAISFTLFSEATEFEVTKHEVNLIQGVGTTCSIMETYAFDVIANPVISLEANAGICQDGSGVVTCEVSDPDPSFTYDVTWTGSSNVSADQLNGDPFVLQVNSAPGVTPEPSEPLTFTAYVEDSNGCVSEQESIEIDVLATPILEIVDPLLPDHCSPAQDCMQIALLNEGLDVNVNILYFWDNQPGTTSNNHCVNFTNPTSCPFVDSMNVTVRFAHALASGETLFCLSSTMDSTLVKPTPEPHFTLTAPQACLDTAGGNCVPFLHDTTAYDLCVDDSLSYEWFVTPLGDLIQNDLEVEDLNTPFPTVCLDTAGVVNLVLEITNAYGCSQTTSNVPYTVRGLPVPELTFSQPSICLPTTVSVLNSSAGASDFSMSIPGYPTYENFLSPLVLNVEYPGYYNAEFSVSNTHTIGSHELTCTVETEYIKAFQGRTPPVAEFAVLPDTMIEYVNPVVEFVNLSEGQIENIWSFGNGEGSSERDPEVEYEAAGTYNAQLLVVNEYGCTDVYTQPIEVFTDLYVYVPTSFTPNNDGLNDAWAPSIIGQDVIAKYDCWVFNRTGHTVFHTNDPNKAWIGGNDLSGEGLHYSGGAEVFVWRIAIKKKDGEGAKVYEGHVTMVR